MNKVQKSLPALVVVIAALAIPSQAGAGATGGFRGGRVWYVRSVEIMPAELPVPPRSGVPLGKLPRVPVRDRLTSSARLTASGAVTQRMRFTQSFATAHAAAEYGRPLQRPTRQQREYAEDGGALPSPLVPMAPLFTYRQLQRLPTDPAAFMRVVARVSRAIEAKVTPRPPATTIGRSAHTQFTASAHGVEVGQCCGSSAAARGAVGDLNAIEWLSALPLPAVVRHGLFRLAAGLPAVHDRGVAADPLGRRGIDLTVGHGAERMQVFFARGSDAVLAVTMSFGARALAAGFGPDTSAILAARWVPARAGQGAAS